MKVDKVWVVIPAFNEGKVLRSVIEPLIKENYHIVIVDDASVDNTYNIARELPVHVCRHTVNLGQGAALQTGIQYALMNGADYIVTYDADGQHIPENIPKLLKPLIDGNCSVALGTRFDGKGQAIGIPRTKLIILKVAAFYSRLVTGLSITDTHNGSRAFTAEAAKKLNITQNRMAHASQLLNQVSEHNMTHIEVPVVIRYTSYSLAKGQKISNLFNILWESFMELLKK